MSAAPEIWVVIIQGVYYQADTVTIRQWIMEGRIHPLDKIKKGELAWNEIGRVPVFRDCFPGWNPNQAPRVPTGPLPNRAKPTKSNLGRNLLIAGVCLILTVMVYPMFKFIDRLGRPDWRDFSSIEGSFSVTMPGKPKVTVENTPSPVGNLSMHLFSVENSQGEFGVAYIDYPNIPKDVPAEKLLEYAIKGALNSTNSTLVDRKDIKMEGYPGVEVTMQTAKEKVNGGSNIAVSRLVWVPPRLYMVFASGDQNDPQKGYREQFFQSFKLNVKKALAKGDEVQDSSGNTALIRAAQRGDAKLVQEFITDGANVNAKNIYGETALMKSIGFCYRDTALLLIEAGANINDTDVSGNTALILAAERGNAICNDVIAVLLDKGADTQIHNRDGKTAISLAKEHNSTQTIDLMRRHGVHD